MNDIELVVFDLAGTTIEDGDLHESRRQKDSRHDRNFRMAPPP